MEDLRRQQQEDRERIRALEKQLNAADVRYRQDMERLGEEVRRSQRCCISISDLQGRISEAENKISSASESFSVQLNHLASRWSEGGESKGGGEAGGGGDDGLRSLLKDLELRLNSSVQQSEQVCSHLDKDLKDFVYRELGDLRTVFSDRNDDRTFRIEDLELEVEQMKGKMADHDKRLSEVENNTSVMRQRMESDCGCSKGGGGGAGGGGGGGEAAGGFAGMDEGKGGAEEEGSQREELSNTTRKSLAWRVIANEGQIRHFNTRLKDLSVSGDSLQDWVS